jgi:hypothetical protein
MKKLLLSGFTAVALMAAGTTQAADLSLLGETGLARTPLAIALPPMTIAVAADYVGSDSFQVPIRAAIGLPYGIEISGAYDYIDSDLDPSFYNVGGKWVLPPFAEGLGLGLGAHYNFQNYDNLRNEKQDNDGYDFYGVASYTAKLGEGMALIPSVGVKWVTVTGDDDRDAWKYFGSLLFKAPKWSIGGEYLSADTADDTIDEFLEEELDGFYWFGGRFYLNPMITLQAGYLNNTNWHDGEEKYEDGVFHIGAQIAFSSGQ